MDAGEVVAGIPREGDTGSCVLIISAFAVAACGRFSNTVPPGSTSLPKMPSAHIWKSKPKCPAVSGVAALVPPKELV